MDSKTFSRRLAKSLGQDQHSIDAMIDAMADVFRRSATSLTSVAIPSFGAFTPVKTDEEVVTDHSTGKRLLLPPQITVEFVPAAMLRKKLS